MSYEGVKPHVRDHRTGGMTEVPNTPTKVPGKTARRTTSMEVLKGKREFGTYRQGRELLNEDNQPVGKHPVEVDVRAKRTWLARYPTTERAPERVPNSVGSLLAATIVTKSPAARY
jgi:hypothetical protein